MPTVRLEMPVRAASDYGVLMERVRAAGLLKRSVCGYLPRLLSLSAAIAAGMVLLTLLGNSWWQLVAAVYAGIVAAQLGFLGHEAGHQQIFTTRAANDGFGRAVSTLGVGLSYGWWVDKHNRHHRDPNVVGRDPDVGRNVLAWTRQQADEQRGVFRLVSRHQAGLFFPFLVLEGWSLHVAGVRSLLRVRPAGWRRESVLLAVHVVVTLGVLLVVMSPVKVLVFVAVQQSVFGFYVGATFAPNHKGMLMPGPERELDFFRRQVLTSRNVRGGRMLSLVLGRLNFQVEHHLFPSMPSHRLRACRPLVVAFCRERDVPYTETGLVGSYRQALAHLAAVTRTAAAPTASGRSASRRSPGITADDRPAGAALGQRSIGELGGSGPATPGVHQARNGCAGDSIPPPNIRRASS